ncbi:MAG: GNAT family N-acetyltransferase [Anaerolineales bacterium]
MNLAHLIPQLQAQLRYGASQGLEPVSVPPFTFFYNPDSDSLFANYAIPDMPIEGDLRDALATLKTAFHERGRTPRLEYLEGFAPDLAQALEANGFIQEIRTLLMVCTPDSYRTPQEVPGLVIRLVHGNSPMADQRAAVTVQRRSFGSDDAPEVTEEEAIQYFTRWARQQMFLAKVNGEPVSVASLMPPYQGLAEVAGIATLSAFRRQGIGAAITAHAVQRGFEQGLGAVFLTAMDERTGRVYTRVGFQGIGSGLAYVKYPSI